MQTRGEGVKKSKNFADIICTWPLINLPKPNKTQCVPKIHPQHATDGPELIYVAIPRGIE